MHRIWSISKEELSSLGTAKHLIALDTHSGSHGLLWMTKYQITCEHSALALNRSFRTIIAPICLAPKPQLLHLCVVSLLMFVSEGMKGYRSALT